MGSPQQVIFCFVKMALKALHSCCIHFRRPTNLHFIPWPVFPVPQQASTQTQYNLKYSAESVHHELFIPFSLLVCIISLIWIWHWCQIRHAYSLIGYWLTFRSNNDSSLELFCIRLDFHFWLTAAVKASTWLWFWSFQFPSTFRELNL